MKIGLIPINVGQSHVDHMVGLAQLAEQVGFESVWTFEHTIVPVDYQSRYPYDESGKMGVEPETNFVDPLIALTAVAAQTKTLKLGTGVNILPQTNPIYLAKQAASLDLVSNGRFMLGVGIGWLKEEFAALGVPYERRGARFDDYIQAMRKLWSGEVVEHKSDFIDWSGFKSYPVPVQDPLPVVIGGSKGKAFQRIAKYGQGWYAPVNQPDQLDALLPSLDAALEKEGRTRDQVEISAMWIPAASGMDAVEGFKAQGVSRLVVPLMALMGDGTPVDALKNFGDQYLSKL